jgi:hypothetical protein
MCLALYNRRLQFVNITAIMSLSGSVVQPAAAEGAAHHMGPRLL